MAQEVQRQNPQQSAMPPREDIVRLPETIPQIVSSIKAGTKKYDTCSDDQKKHIDVIAAAVYQDPRIIVRVPEKALQAVLEGQSFRKLVKINGDVLPNILTLLNNKNLDPNIRGALELYANDKSLWKEAALHSLSTIAQIPTKLFTEKEYINLIKEIIIKNTEAYNYLDSNPKLNTKFKENREIALTLINTNQGINHLQEISEKLRNDGNFIREAIKLNGEFFSVLLNDFKDDVKTRTALSKQHLETAVPSDSQVISRMNSSGVSLVP